MATLKGKWKVKENLVIPDSINVSATCVFNWGDYDMLSDPEDGNLTSGISFYRGTLSANGSMVYNGSWVQDYNTWSVIDFGNTERIVSNKFYEIFTANAVPIERTVAVTCDGDTLAQLKHGQAVTLKTANRIVDGDIKVSVPKEMEAQLNIIYGYTAPVDTSKLWVKCDEPTEVIIRNTFDSLSNENGAEDFRLLKTKLPKNSRFGTSAVVNNKIYLFKPEGIYVFDPSDHSIKTLDSSYSHIRDDATNGVFGNKIYLFTSAISNPYVSVFDTSTNSFNDEGITLPISLQYPTTAAVNNKVYLFGGVIPTLGDLVLSSRIHVFDPSNNSLETLDTTLPTGMTYMGSIVIDNKVYLFGGLIGQEYNDKYGYYENFYSDKVYVFNPADNTIEELNSTFPIKMEIETVSLRNGKVYLFGREAQAVNPFTLLFDPSYNGFEYTSYPHYNISGFVSASVDNTIYLFGGYQYENESTLDAIHSIEDVYDVPNKRLFLLNQGNLNKVPLIKTHNIDIEIGVKRALFGNYYGKGDEVTAALYKDGAWVEI